MKSAIEHWYGTLNVIDGSRLSYVLYVQMFLGYLAVLMSFMYKRS